MGKKRQGMTDYIYIYIMQELRHIYFGENIYFSKMVILFWETYIFFEENYLMFAFWNLLKNCNGCILLFSFSPYLPKNPV